MDYSRIKESLNRFGSSDDDICMNTLGVHISDINEKVIISPGWQPEHLFAADKMVQIVDSSPLFGFKIWNIHHNEDCFTYIRTGYGASMVMDASLLLGLTGCKKILFVSSIGGLTKDIHIGDIVIPEFSANGDGASRYLSDDLGNAAFEEKQYPEQDLLQELLCETEHICGKNCVNWHVGRTICVDTIVAQYSHINTFVSKMYNSIDMESAVAFKAARMMNIPIAALLSVSDNSIINKSLLTSIDARKEREYRVFVRNQIIPQIIYSVLSK